mmetsp:Transcript_84326/g.149049  ORF Transcript_84326/g.149049 Transcript_84326/m.149049 type:complete len:300 (-) Transcript_84326:21-920(-)
MLRCLSQICGSTGDAAEQPNEKQLQRQPVVKPLFRLDEIEESTAVQTLQSIASSQGLDLAPPGAEQPVAAVSKDFQRNASRVLILVPAGDASGWAIEMGGKAAAIPLLRWAEANNYAVAIFSPQALKSQPSQTWERVVKGSPSRCASVVVAASMLCHFQAALEPVHPLLFGRFRTVCIHAADSIQDVKVLPADLRQHMEVATVVMPPAWDQLDIQVSCQSLFELLRDREEAWSKLEVAKYSGFQGLKENDMPGLKRMAVDQRVKRLDRDRNDDELARLLKKHEQARHQQNDEEEEPGID